MKRTVWPALELLGAVFWLLGVWGYCLGLFVGYGMSNVNGQSSGLILLGGDVIGLVPIALLRTLRTKRGTPPALALRGVLLIVVAVSIYLLTPLSGPGAGSVVDIGRYSHVSGTVTHSGIDSNDNFSRETEGYVYFENPLDEPLPHAYRFHDLTNQTLAPGKNLMRYVRDGDQISKSFFSGSLTLTRNQQISRWNYVPQPPIKYY